MVEFTVIFLVCYIWHSLGVTIGYHRLLSHRSFACPKWVEYFFVLGGYLAFEGSPIWWATIHRAHHRYVDTALDPHSPRYGLKEAHVGWLTHKTYPEHINPETQARDLLSDPVYRFLEQGGVWARAHFCAFALGITLRVIIFFYFGWVAALASALAAVLVLQIPLMLNVVCHIPKLGYKRYATEDDSVNVWWVALLAMGEGWHNNHHASPGSAKTGMQPWELDVSWLVISLMRKLKIATRVNACTHEQLVRQAAAHALKGNSIRAQETSTVLPQMEPVKQTTIATIATPTLVQTTAPALVQTATPALVPTYARVNTKTPVAMPTLPAIPALVALPALMTKLFPTVAWSPEIGTTPDSIPNTEAKVPAKDNLRLLPNTLPNAVPIKRPGLPISLPVPAPKLVPVPVSPSRTARNQKFSTNAGYRKSR